MQKKRVIKIFAVILALFGSATLAWIFYPIFLYQFTSTPSMTFLSPIPDEVKAQAQNNIDYTKASNWLPKAKEVHFDQSNTTSYKLSIPRLNIKKATVAIGGEDLSLSLIQYPGTAAPGQVGNSVIFGHSVLPAFYNPTNYLTIFSTIPTLIKGDIITVDYDGITYKYQVEEKFEVEATDLQILDQDKSDSFLTLVTCVPPGLKTRRGVIRARIVPIRST